MIGRGICPKCGREGSVVFKEISGRIYVYVKHGRKWCYLGPLDTVELSGVIVSLRDYHTFTTKLVDYIKSKLEVSGVRVSTLFISGLALLLTAYSIGLGGPVYGNYVLALVSLSTLLFLVAIATYEGTYAKLRGYSILSAIISKGLSLYMLLTVVLIICVVIATIPLVAPIRLEFTCKFSCGETKLVIPITSLIISSLTITYLSRPLSGNLRKFTTYIIVSVAIGYTIVFIMPLLYHTGSFMELATLKYLVTSTSLSFTITMIIIVAFTVLLEILKKIIRI